MLCESGRFRARSPQGPATSYAHLGVNAPELLCEQHRYRGSSRKSTRNVVAGGQIPTQSTNETSKRWAVPSQPVLPTTLRAGAVVLCAVAVVACSDNGTATPKPSSSSTASSSSSSSLPTSLTKPEFVTKANAI